MNNCSPSSTWVAISGWCVSADVDLSFAQECWAGSVLHVLQGRGDSGTLRAFAGEYMCMDPMQVLKSDDDTSTNEHWVTNVQLQWEVESRNTHTLDTP